MQVQVQTAKSVSSGFQLNQDRFTRREGGLLFFLVLAAFFLRLFILQFHPLLSGDGVWYATLGKNLISGNLKEGLSTYWPPFYPVLVGISSLFFRDLEFAGLIVSVVTGSLLVIPVYLLGRGFYSKRVAIVAAIFTILHPLLILYSVRLLTESTYTLLLASAIVAGLYALSNGRAIFYFLTGLALGACYLTRPEAIAYIILLPIASLLIGLLYQQWRLKYLIFTSLILFSGFFLLAAPYIVYLHKTTGIWTPSQKFTASIALPTHSKKNPWRALIQDEQTTLADKLWAGSAVQPKTTNVAPSISPPASRSLKSLLPNPGRMKNEIKSLLMLFSPFFIFLSCLGLFRTRWSKQRVVKETYWGLFLLSTVLGYSLSPVFEERYWIPFLPLFICWASKGIFEFEGWLVGSLKKVLSPRAFSPKTGLIVRSVLIVTLIFLSFIPAIRGLLKNQEGDPQPIAMWIKAQSNAPPVIMATNPWPAFYSGGKHIYIPDEEYPVVLQYARNKGVEYLVLEEDSMEATPNLVFLFDEQNAPPDLKLVYQYNAIPNRKILVFELVSSPNLPEGKS